MFSLVFSFQWNIALNSFIMETYYVSEMGNNFNATIPPSPPRPTTPPSPPPPPLPPKKVALPKTTRPFGVR